MKAEIKENISQKYPKLRDFLGCIDRITALKETIKKTSLHSKTDEARSTDYQYLEKMAMRNPDDDRIFPMDTVAIKRFNTDFEADIEKAIIHTGPSADEYARSLNASALAVAFDIYFRNNMFNPSSKEGRKTIAHELTHVAQHTEGRINANVTLKDLEVEAETAETLIENESDPYIVVAVKNKRCRMRKSELKQFAYMAADKIETAILWQKNNLSEEKYLRLLCEYEKWLKGV